MDKTAVIIEQKAYELGYEKLGIVRIDTLAGYDDMLAERMSSVPASAGFYEKQKRLTRLPEQYPWAKSVIVAVRSFRNYNVPASAAGHIGKHYLFDGRVTAESDDYKNSLEMERFLKGLGLKTATDRHFGLVGLRWAAMKAGLCIVRRNNFFYTESGSWVSLEAWITDGDLELVQVCGLPACPKNCRRRIEACPTRSLSAPYTMSPVSCVSFMTTFGMNDLSHHPLASRTLTWIYGCDTCQDVCPMNQGKWEGGKGFPGLSEIASLLTPENILKLDEMVYREKIQPRFFYLKPDDLWKWKTNALNYMRAHYDPVFKPSILAACGDTHEKVRQMAEDIAADLF